MATVLFTMADVALRMAEFGWPCGGTFIPNRSKCWTDPKTGRRLKKPMNYQVYQKIRESNGKAAQTLYKDREQAIRDRRRAAVPGWKTKPLSTPKQESQPTTGKAASLQRLDNSVDLIKKSNSINKPRNAFVSHSPGNYDGGGSQFDITFDRNFVKNAKLKSAIENITGYGYLHLQEPIYKSNGDTVVVSWRNPDYQSSRIPENIKMISDRLEKAGIKTPKPLTGKASEGDKVRSGGVRSQSPQSKPESSASTPKIKSYEDAAKTPKGGWSNGDADNMRATYAQGIAILGGGLPDNPKMIYDWSVKHNVDLDDLIAKQGRKLTRKAVEDNSDESLALMKALYNDKPLNIKGKSTEKQSKPKKDFSQHQNRADFNHPIKRRLKHRKPRCGCQTQMIKTACSCGTKLLPKLVIGGKVWD